MAAEMYLPRFFIKQKFAMTTNRYEIYAANPDGTEGQLMAVAQQKRLAFKEEVTFYTDDSKSRPVFSFKARKKLDLNAGYDIYDEQRRQIGFFRRGKLEVPQLILVHGRFDFGRGPAAPGHRLCLRCQRIGAARQGVPLVVEMDDALQRLEISVVHIGLWIVRR